jgi:flavin reductase (DIM6/NTAB) family NADH-FMN oxidoreductase RutF
MDGHVTPESFKAALAAVCTPVAVVTTMHDGRAHGTTVSSFCSLSLDPPMILVSLDRSSELLSLVQESGRYGVNVLAVDQPGIARAFARKGADKFVGIEHEMVDGLPRIAGAAVWLRCRLAELVDGGDHVIAIGLVEHAVTEPAEPLMYHDRTFRWLEALQADTPALANAACA